jgi:hypothetical protein
MMILYLIRVMLEVMTLKVPMIQMNPKMITSMIMILTLASVHNVIHIIAAQMKHYHHHQDEQIQDSQWVMIILMMIKCFIMNLYTHNIFLSSVSQDSTIRTRSISRNRPRPDSMRYAFFFKHLSTFNSLFIIIVVQHFEGSIMFRRLSHKLLKL